MGFVCHLGLGVSKEGVLGMAPTEMVLEVRNATKAYEGFTLRDVSFQLPRGYIMGLIGHNGAGKTTLLNSVLNLVRLDDGEIRVFGLDHR